MSTPPGAIGDRRPPVPARERFRGRIAGVGSTSGVRLVVGNWSETPLGSFADVMVERADGHRILLAPCEAVRDVIVATYVFDEVRIEPVAIEEHRDAWLISAPSLDLDLTIGRRPALGHLLKAVPPPLATSTAWASLVDPIAFRLVGVSTRGTARAGLREWYGATDLRSVTALAGRFDDASLGGLAPVDPPCRFGFSSTPRTPSLTTVVTTIGTVADRD